MKKIINEKSYDTSTATIVGTWTNGYYDSDLYLIEEFLYRKKSGEFFIYGRGGAGTKYSAPRECAFYGSGSTIKPMTDDEAKAWAMEHLDGDAYEDLFGEVAE